MTIFDIGMILYLVGCLICARQWDKTYFNPKSWNAGKLTPRARRRCRWWSALAVGCFIGYVVFWMGAVS